ncbi:ATP synthase mitochondrial F1 complex assembly factor 2 [Entomophthora muscae]|uniref:ATP synthase mitochondrial F1 complex assembly factor 2 n=1 Tax=Entomophthora muscae TaxID=34485 RepID=A0ACC2RKC5_9FUNG|nr:ATP synthase mitochondrial F1 complex assembly factor 2 [Entomophthora muscae]
MFWVCKSFSRVSPEVLKYRSLSVPDFRNSKCKLKISTIVCPRLFSTCYSLNQLSGTKASIETDGGAREKKLLEAKNLRNRFWKAASLRTSEEGYEICLDGRILRTPNGVPLRIPPNRTTFAHLVAGEWESQEKVLKTHALPLTSLAARAIDGLNTEESRIEVVSLLSKYLDTDSVCYQQDFPQKLVKLQSEHFDPILSWVEKKFGLKPNVTSSIIGSKQPEKVTTALQKAALQLDPLEIAGFERATIAAKSFIIGLALMHREISVETAAQASHVEVQFQISQWGEVEDTHDVDHQSIRRNFGAAVATTLRD